MIKARQTIREFFEHPQISQTMSEEGIEIVHNRCRVDEKTDPLYIRILISSGAWCSAIFLIMFLYVAEIVNSDSGAFIAGIVFLGAAIAISKINKNTFFSQVSLALAFAGNCLVLSGFSSIKRSASVELYELVIVHAAICFIIYPLFSNNIYRFIAPIALAMLVVIWIVGGEYFYLDKVKGVMAIKGIIAINGVIAMETVLFGYLALRKKRTPYIVPLIYSSAAMLPATLLFLNIMNVAQIGALKNIFEIEFVAPIWPSNIFLSIGLIYLFIHLSGGFNSFHKAWLIIATCAIIALGAFTTPGILVTIGLLVIGYAYGDRILTGLTYAFIPCFLIIFYYALNVDLAYKSLILMGNGLVLLLAGWMVNYFQTKEKVA